MVEWYAFFKNNITNNFSDGKGLYNMLIEKDTKFICDMTSTFIHWVYSSSVHWISLVICVSINL